MSPRIVSLLASATEIVCELGLEDGLVGISHECDHPERILDRPRVSRPRFDPSGLDSGQIDRAVRHAMTEFGSVYEVHAEALEALDPDLVLTQAVCDVCAVPTAGVRELLEARGLTPHVFSLDAHTLDEILETVLAVGSAADAPDRAARWVLNARQRLDLVAQAVAGAARPTVLAIEWLDPPFAPGHWVPEMIRLAGGDDLLGAPGRPSRELDWDEMGGGDPDVLLVMPCGYGLDAARADADRFAERLRSVAPRAISESSAYVIDASSYLNRSGPRVIAGVEILAGLLHPGLVPPPAAGTAEVWRPRTAGVSD